MKHIIIIVILLLSHSCVILQNSMPDRIDNWEKYDFEKIRDYNEIVEYVQKQDRYRVIGTINTEIKDYDIYEIFIDNKAQKTILIFGGVHGDELSGVSSCINFIENYKLDKFPKKFNYIIVPVVNPWGYEYNIRYNSLGIDINRDFTPNKFDTQEAEIIHTAYKNLSPYIVIDNHEDNWQSKNYYFLYNSKTVNLMRKFIDDTPSYLYDNESKYSIFKTKNGINHIKNSILWLVKLSDRYTLSNYFLGKTDNVVVIESGSVDVTLEKRDLFHLHSKQYIIKNF